MFNDDYTIRRPADFDYNAAIAELEEQVRHKKHVQSQQAHFMAEVDRLSRLEESRRNELAQENADVKRLQRISPAVILYTVIGKKADMLAREEAEALAAAARYETVRNQLDYAESRVRALSAELRGLGNCELRLEEMIEEKKQRLRAEDAAATAEMSRLEAAIRAVDGQLREVEQALDKGSRVRGLVRGILDHLGRAHDLSTADIGLLRRPGHYLLDSEKHDHLDTAQAMLRTLGQYLQEFTAELEDVELDARDLPTTLQVGEVTRTLDLFFDHLFADFAVRRHITSSLEEMDTLLCKVEAVLEGLVTRKAALEAERQTAEEALKRFVRES